MLEIFSNWFSRKRRSAIPVRRACLDLESCEPRDLPSASVVFAPATRAVSIQGTATSNSASVTQSGNRLIVRADGQTRVFVASGVSQVRFSGGNGNDTLVNTTSIRTVASGGTGNDRLVGGTGNDCLEGGIGTDQLTGGRGTDALGGGAGNDVISGSSGDDDLEGDAGNDCLYGNADDDTLEGGAGMDRLTGGLGFDQADDDGVDKQTGCESGALLAMLNGDDCASGYAELHAAEEEEEVSFEVYVSGLAANQTYDVNVGNTTIGQITTDDEGTGELELAELIVTITPGTVLTVLDSEGNVVLRGVFHLDDYGNGDDGTRC